MPCNTCICFKEGRGRSGEKLPPGKGFCEYWDEEYDRYHDCRHYAPVWSGGEPKGSSLSSSGGCYIATCVYGSYDCYPVWTLRRFRDGVLAETRMGRAFIRSYYAISPSLVKRFGRTRWFRRFWRTGLDALVKRLNVKGISGEPYKDREQQN